MAKSLSQIMKRSGDFTKVSNQILHNRFVLYFIFILAVGNLFHFVFSKDMMSVGAFIASGLLTSFFSKNMVVIMVIAMVVSNVIRLSNGRDGFKVRKKEKWQVAMDEMFENAMNEAFEEDDEDEDEDDDEEMDDGDYEEGFNDMRAVASTLKGIRSSVAHLNSKLESNEEKIEDLEKSVKTKKHKHSSGEGHEEEEKHKLRNHPH